MRIRQKNISYYYKYLISYIAILIVPILIIGLYVNISIFKTLEQEVITNEVNALYQVKNSIESQQLQIEKIKEEVYLNTNKTPFYFKEDPLQALERIKELKYYQVTNTNLSDVFLYYCGDDYIYSSSGSCRIKMFLEDIFCYEQWDKDDFFNTINIIQKPLYRPIESIKLVDNVEKRYATMIYPLSVSCTKPYAMLIFIIPEEFYESRINTMIDNHSKITIIIDNNDKIIASSKKEPFIHTYDFKELIKEQNQINETNIELQNKEYIVSGIHSEQTGWKYITLTPKKNIMNKIKDVKLGFLFGTILVIIIGFLVINVLMHVNYDPIKKLKKYSESIVDDTKGSVGELDLVKEAMDFLSDQNALLNNEVTHSNEANKQYITMQILRGCFPIHKEIEGKAKKYGIHLNDSCSVAILYVNTNNNTITNKIIIDELKGELSDTVTIYECDHLDLKKIIMILSLKEEQYKNLYKKFDYTLKHMKKQFDSTTFTVGIGNCYKEKKFIPKAYIEASTAIDYRLVKGNGCVIMFNEIIKQQVALETYPQGNLENIANLLKNGKIEGIENELDSIINYIKNNNTPIFIARGLCFDIINLIFQTSQEIVKEFNNNLDIPDVFVITKYDTVDELALVAKNLSHDLCSQIIKQKQKEELSLIHDMVIYIKNNYSNCDFSLYAMADYFNMSQSSLSMYFKDKTEDTILNYVTRIKMKKAKEILISTNIPLSKLAESIGYSNVTSFIRRFKQCEGITPGEYRKQHI